MHRNLRDSVLVDEPSDRLRTLERSGNHHGLARFVRHDLTSDRVPFALRTAFLTNIERDGIRPTRRCGVQVEIDRDQKIPRTDGGCSGTSDALVEYRRAEVGFPVVGTDPVFQTFVFTFTAVSKIST